SELVPTAFSVRLASAFWWFFILVIISSYTANLAAFLTVNKLNEISTLAQLVNQESIKYSIVSTDSTYTFFSTSKDPIYSKMFKKMVQWNATGQTSFIESPADALRRIRVGGFAGVLESPLVDFYRERDCELTQVGETFSPSAFGFGVAQG
uniref:PBPe domain-containing protein n=1 Tax=Macrostomum lignano TaxID=282301 RepID=A0A1I8GCW2_9PLAT